MERGSRVVAHLLDGTLIRGYTEDFRPGRPAFNILTAPEAVTVHIGTAEMKALFFVKSLTGDKKHVQDNRFGEDPGRIGRRAWVVFQDGEEIAGRVLANKESAKGFYLFPVDTKSNLERAWIVTENASSVLLGDDATEAANRYQPHRQASSVTKIAPEEWDDMLRLKDIATPQRWRGSPSSGKARSDTSDLFLGDW